MLKRSATLQCLVALALGFLVGSLASNLQSVAVDPWLAAADATIRLWTNALRLVVTPLIVAQIFVAVAGQRPEKGDAARLGMALPAVFIGIQLLMVTVCVVVTSGMLQLAVFQDLTISSAPAAPAAAGAAAGRAGDASAWIDQLIPPNLLAAAGSDGLLALIIIALAFALAARRLAPEFRLSLGHSFQAIRDACYVLVGWLLVVAPLILFALAFRSATRGGLELGQLMLAYLAIAIATTLVGIAVMYLVATLGGKVPLGRFAKAVFPAQVAAVATRSSLATLPTLLKESDVTLKLPPKVSALVLPLAGALLKPSRASHGLSKLLLLAHVLGLQLDFTQLALFTVLMLLMSATAVGIPTVLHGNRLLPVYASLGIPPEYVLALGSTVALIDVGSTVLNSTGYLAANTVVARLLGSRSPAEPEAGPAPLPVEVPKRGWRLPTRRAARDKQAAP